MSDTSPQEAVSQLKALLFDREARELDTLNRRLAEMDVRAGSEERFQKAVARVLDGALRDAEVTRHRELSDALAPMVLRTLRVEMKSAEMQDQIAGVMYPRMGEMVARYVSSAIRDMMQEINRRLEAGLTHNRFFLWIRSLTSGRSMAELALGATQRLEVQEIYLVRRGSGSLVHHWRRPGTPDDVGGNNRDTLVSGFLAAITALAEEAFDAAKESLRTIDLDDHRIYLRGSPDYLLAAKCVGSAPAGIDRNLDAELVRVLADHAEIERKAPSGGRDVGMVASRNALLAGFSERIEEAAQERTAEVSRAHGARTLKVLLWMIGLPLIAFAGWYFYVGFVTQSLQTRANGVIAGIPALKGFPVRAHVERGGRRMWVAGLAPDEATHRLVLSQLKDISPDAELSDAIGVLPRSDVQARLIAEGFRRAAERAQRKLTALAADLSATRSRIQGSSDSAALADADSAVQMALEGLRRPMPDAEGGPPAARLRGDFDKLAEAASKLAQLAGSDASPPQTPPQDATESADALALVSDRIGGLIGMLEQRHAVAPITKRLDDMSESVAARTAELRQQAEARIAALEQRIRELRPEPATPRQRLGTFVRSHAVFFSNDSQYRDPSATGNLLKDLATLVRESGATLRVVGYTDEVGTAARNSPLSQARAEKVVADLVARGVPQGRLIAIGRLNSAPIAAGSGVESPNRRVEFELAFDGEKGGAP
ncbi:MAG: OmpA family protein [Hyphomicrobiaceae bacterium]